jgi:hypothetical protein
MLFAHSIDWLLTNRSADFMNEWNTKFRILPLFSKLLPLFNQHNTSNTIPQSDMLISKYLLIANNIPSNDLCNNIIDDLFKASPRELTYIFRAIGVVLHQIANEDKCKLIENSINIINEVDHRMPIYWPCLTAFSKAISSSVTDITISNLLNPVRK